MGFLTFVLLLLIFFAPIPFIILLIKPQKIKEIGYFKDKNISRLVVFLTMLAVEFVLIVVFFVVMANEPAPTKEKNTSEAVALKIQPDGTTSFVEANSKTKKNVTKEDAKNLIVDLETFANKAKAINGTSDLGTLNYLSNAINTIVENAKVFGPTIMDEPYGFCYGAAISLQAAWLEKIKPHNPYNTDPEKSYVADLKECKAAVK